MPDYSKGQIYKIYCNITGETYYGSTVNTLAKRMGKHRTEAKENSKKNVASRSIINRGDYDCSLIENYECNNKQELHARERYWIENNECVNKKIPGRTKKEWYEANKDKNKKREKGYYEANKDKISEQKKGYYEANKDKISERDREYRQNNKDKISEQKKEWYEANKDKISEQKKGYYDTNKDKISEHKKEKVICECGCEISRTNLSRHRKTKFHQEFIQSLASGGNTI